MAARRYPLALPDDMLVEIVGSIAETSTYPMEDICSLRATCQDMCRACKDDSVGRRWALEREESIRWFQNDRYLALVDNLATANNPEACFVLGVTFVFVKRCTPLDTQWLQRAADAGHKVAAYVLGIHHHGCKEKEEVERYIRQVEDEGGVIVGCKQASRMTNRDCARYRAHAVKVVHDVTWKVARTAPLGALPPVPPADEDRQGCGGSGCGVPEGWANDYAFFCSEGCRIRHEYSSFFSRVSLPIH